MAGSFGYSGGSLDGSSLVSGIAGSRWSGTTPATLQSTHSGSEW